MANKEFFKALGWAIQNDIDVVVARFPRIAHEFTSFALVERCHLVAQPVQCVAQRLSPVLVPARPPGIASAIRHPASHPMRTTPGALLMDLDLMCRRMFLEVFAVVCELREVLAFDHIESVSQSHFAVAMVVPV